MPRRIRIDLPSIPQHIVQRGNDRQPCFIQDIDRIRNRGRGPKHETGVRVEFFCFQAD